MADEPTTPETGIPADPGTPTPPANLPDDHPLVKAYKATKAQLAEARDKLREADDAGKTELERLTEQVTRLTQDRDTLTAERDRYVVALEKKLTPTQAKRLVGSSLDELTADAEALLADLGMTSDQQGEPPSRQPRPALSGGTDPVAAEIGSDDIRAAVEAAARGRL